eukprot:352312-Chlamydomonas_euryale.AAC.5
MKKTGPSRLAKSTRSATPRMGKPLTPSRRIHAGSPDAPALPFPLPRSPRPPKPTGAEPSAAPEATARARTWRYAFVIAFTAAGQRCTVGARTACKATVAFATGFACDIEWLHGGTARTGQRTGWEKMGG